MRQIDFLWVIVLAFTMTACGGEDENDTFVDQVVVVFEDGFESENNDFSDLFPQNGSRWSNIQVVNPEGVENQITLSQEVVLSGNNSLKVLSNRSGEILSKVDIEKGGLNIPLGSELTIEANFYIASADNIKNLFLMDLECCSCWDPSVPDNQCPGIRLIMSGENDFLSIERGKILEPTLIQSSKAFPRNEWVNVKWEMTLSSENDGLNKLYINGEEVISTMGVNMPNAESFREEFAKNGIEFQLQSPLFYDRIQLGATANASVSDVTMYLDDFNLMYVESEDK